MRLLLLNRFHNSPEFFSYDVNEFFFSSANLILDGLNQLFLQTGHIGRTHWSLPRARAPPRVSLVSTLPRGRVWHCGATEGGRGRSRGRGSHHLIQLGVELGCGGHTICRKLDGRRVGRLFSSQQFLVEVAHHVAHTTGGGEVHRGSHCR